MGGINIELPGTAGNTHQVNALHRIFDFFEIQEAISVGIDALNTLLKLHRRQSHLKKRETYTGGKCRLDCIGESKRSVLVVAVVYECITFNDLTSPRNSSYERAPDPSTSNFAKASRSETPSFSSFASR